MRTRSIAKASERTHVLVFDSGDDVMPLLKSFAAKHALPSAHFTAIGALARVTLGYFDWTRKAYLEIPIEEQVEVVSLIGDVAHDADGKPQVHAHVVVGKRDGSAHGGHLLAATVRPTLELVLVESPAFLRRRYDPESGLALIDPQA
ncbi:MAG TPA: PPC domain-containing DNA-binding protein [Casimicrobiaceae bacterium]|nr:PPC domain-containing DNA-binding protein [Casimicrobiaceae bacterium]